MLGRRKDRLKTRGQTQTYGIDYTQTVNKSFHNTRPLIVTFRTTIFLDLACERLMKSGGTKPTIVAAEHEI